MTIAKILLTVALALLEIAALYPVIFYFRHTKELQKRYWGKNRKWLEDQISRCVIAGMAIPVFWYLIVFTV